MLYLFQLSCHLIIFCESEIRFEHTSVTSMERKIKEKKPDLLLCFTEVKKKKAEIRQIQSLISVLYTTKC